MGECLLVKTGGGKKGIITATQLSLETYNNNTRSYTFTDDSYDYGLVMVGASADGNAGTTLTISGTAPYSTIDLRVDRYLSQRWSLITKPNLTTSISCTGIYYVVLAVYGIKIS